MNNAQYILSFVTTSSVAVDRLLSFGHPVDLWVHISILSSTIQQCHIVDIPRHN